jgi:xanthine dehydrogenase YagS FAD-binding subunit
MASALTVLDARVEVATPKGNRLVPIEQFFMRPQKNVLKETVLGPSEMVLAVEIPGPEEGFRGTYVKLKERQAFDFATASVAVGLTLLQGRLV